MRRAVVAGGMLGVITGLVFVFHDALRLHAAWPVIAGFALWGAVGRNGSRGLHAAAGAAAGVAAGYLAYAAVAELFPITRLWLGISTGVAVGAVVLGAVALRGLVPVAAPIVGFVAFAGLFQPLWAESTGALRVHGIETLTVALLAVVLGVLGATAGRAVADRFEAPAGAGARRAEEEQAAERDVSADELFGEGSS